MHSSHPRQQGLLIPPTAQSNQAPSATAESTASTEEEEDVNIKQQLLEHISDSSEHAASLGIASVDAGNHLVCNVTDGF